MSRKKLTVSSNIFSTNDQQPLRAKMLLELFKSAEHCFSEHERRFIRGALKKGDLDVSHGPLVSSKLDEARAQGNVTVQDFRALYQFYSFVRKAPTAGDDDLCRQAGFQKLLKGEEKCLVTNMTLESRITCNYALFDRVKRIIGDILGSVPSNFLTSQNTEVFFGPGSTVNDNNRSFNETADFFKLSDKLIVPEKAKYYLAALVSSHPNWVDALAVHYRTQQNPGESRLNFERRVFRKHFVIVPNDHPSRIGFVPKNSDEHRAIGIEMNGLVPLQKVVGDLIRHRLFKRTGINLDSQERNKHMAKLAKTFELATVDLANASSSISKDLVRALLPYDWWCLIDDFRSEVGLEPKSGTKVTYEMISSMGNGFTFELESLIFYALTKATCEESGVGPLEIKRSVAVYGDDLIVPARVAEQLYKNLTLFGFTANEEKSFLQGFFFESCGADYYDGIDVRPFFLKRDILSIRDLYFLLNSLLFKVVEKEFSNLFGLYRYLFNYLHKQSQILLQQRAVTGKLKQNFKVCYGPLHFVTTKYGRLSTDDLEAVLRVPLEYAQANGGVRFDPNFQAWVYKRWVRVSVTAPLQDMPCHFVRNIRYMTFLKGQQEGKVVLRGRTRATLKNNVTSQWDGLIGIKKLRNVKFLFDTLAL
jgi:hypothetical protein